MALILKIDGTRKDMTPLGENGTLTLEQMQEVVGGYIEQVSAPSSNNVLIVDEEGRLKGKLINFEASAIAQQPIVGDAILCIVSNGNYI